MEGETSRCKKIGSVLSQSVREVLGQFTAACIFGFSK